MKIVFIIALINLSAFAGKPEPKTVTFSSYVADNFKVLSKVKKEKPQVAFQDTSGWRMPASESQDQPGKPTVNPNIGTGGFGSNGASGSGWQNSSTGNLVLPGAANPTTPPAASSSSEASGSAPAAPSSSTGSGQ